MPSYFYGLCGGEEEYFVSQDFFFLVKCLTSAHSWHLPNRLVSCYVSESYIELPKLEASISLTLSSIQTLKFLLRKAYNSECFAFGLKRGQLNSLC